MIKKLLPHGALILAELFIVLNILDSYNPAMGFLTSEASKVVLFIFSGVVAVFSISRLIAERKRPQNNYMKKPNGR